MEYSHYMKMRKPHTIRRLNSYSGYWSRYRLQNYFISILQKEKDKIYGGFKKMRISLHYEAGELEFKRKAQEICKTIEYVGDNPDYWNKDIDFIVNDNITVEVKWDSWINKTGNVFVETENPRSINGCGWFKFTQADLLAYGDSLNGTFYMIKMDVLREYVETHELISK
jgi:hypothetical protein